jgi:hypothetical protein
VEAIQAVANGEEYFAILSEKKIFNTATKDNLK